jgi:hypothetical protein
MHVLPYYEIAGVVAGLITVSDTDMLFFLFLSLSFSFHFNILISRNHYDIRFTCFITVTSPDSWELFLPFSVSNLWWTSEHFPVYVQSLNTIREPLGLAAWSKLMSCKTDPDCMPSSSKGSTKCRTIDIVLFISHITRDYRKYVWKDVLLSICTITRP